MWHQNVRISHSNVDSSECHGMELSLFSQNSALKCMYILIIYLQDFAP